MRQYANSLILISGALGLLACAPAPANLDVMQESIDQRLTETAPQAQPRPKASGNLKASVREAVERNGEYLAARSAEQAALAGIAVAESGRRPQITGNGLAGRIYEGNPSNNVISGASADLMLSQLIYDGGGVRAGIDQATASALAARANAVETGNRIALEAFTAWVKLWHAQEQKKLLEARVGEFDTIAGQLDRMTESGMIDSTLRENARLAQLDIDMQKTRLQGDLIAAEAAFLRHFQTVPASLARPEAILTSKDREALGKGWQNAPSLRRVAAELMAAEAATDIAKAARKPIVSLRSGVSSPMDQQDTTDTSVGFQVQYVFGDGGRRKAQIAVAEAREAGLRAQLADAQVQAQSLLATSLANLAALERSSSLVSEKVDVSAIQAETAQAQIALGQSNLGALMEAHISNYRISEQALQLTAQRLVLQAEIAAGTGQLLDKLGLTETQQ